MVGFNCSYEGAISGPIKHTNNTYLQDNKHGHGTHTWTDGNKYTGEWSNGKKHGNGLYNCADGSR